MPDMGHEESHSNRNKLQLTRVNGSFRPELHNGSHIKAFMEVH
ncbi:MAG: hypothetical protein O2780_13095 [Proteobacteria bacterium]|jgi:hypothetical protein|nr:hypothetical protein [Pseudomonadota bacterium]MDA1301831.1 hypothetical protein [Pseudomonadota bacterium]